MVFQKRKTSVDSMKMISKVVRIMAVVTTVLVIGFIAYKVRRLPEKPQVKFDTGKCLRLSDITRVYKIKAKDSNHNEIWFCTEEGLRVLNEKSAKWLRYGLDHGLPSESVLDICFWKDIPYVATASGMAYFNEKENRFVTLPQTIGKNILAIERIPEAGIFYYVEAEDMYYYNPEKQSPVSIKIPDKKGTRFITCLKEINGELYAGIEGMGIAKYNRQSMTWKKFSTKIIINAETQIGDIIAHNGKLYVASSQQGVWVKSGNSDSLMLVPDFPCKGAFAFSEEKDGFWCGTPWGLWRYHEDRNVWIQIVHPRERTPTDFQVFSLFNSGNTLWYGSKDFGAGFLNKTNVDWQTFHAGLSRSNIAAIAEAEGFVATAYGYQAGNIDLFNASTIQYERNITQTEGLNDPNIQFFLPHSGRIYLGSYEGFGYFDMSTRECRFFSRGTKIPVADVAHISLDDSSRLFLSSLTGIIEYYPQRDSFAMIEETIKYRVTCTFKSGDSIWFGTLGRGLKVFDLRLKKEINTSLESARRINGITSIKDKNGDDMIFAATDDKGCFLISTKDGRITKLIPPEKLIEGGFEDYNNNITVIRRIGDCVWIGTRYSGCVVYDPKIDRWGILTFYDGLITDQIRSLYDSDNYIWVGCYGGINRLDKKYYIENDIPFKNFKE